MPRALAGGFQWAVQERNAPASFPTQPPSTQAMAGPKTPPTTPSPRLIKLQIAAGVFVPMLALGLWLHSQGFW